MTTTRLTDDTLVTYEGCDCCYTPLRGGRVICKATTIEHPELRLINGEIIIKTLHGALEAKHPGWLRPLTVGDVRAYYSKCDQRTCNDAVSACVPR